MADISFNATYYYEQKLAQLQSVDAEKYGSWSIADVALAFEQNGLTAEEHAAQYAAVEGLNVSPDFDTNAYLAAKLGQLQEADAEAYGDWTVEDVAEAFQAAGLSPLDHYNQYGEAEGLEATPVAASGLTEALGTLATAQDELATKLEGLELDTDSDGEIEVEAGDADRDDVTDAMDAAEADVEAELGTGGAFAAAGDNTKQGLIADGRADDQEAIETAQDNLADAEAAAGNAVLTELNSVETRISAYEAAIEKADDTASAEEGEFAKFNAVNTNDQLSFANGDTELQVDNTTVATLNNGVWEVDENADLSAVTGFETYLAALQAETDAANAEADSLTSLQNAVAEVVAVENDDDSITAADLSADVVSIDTREDADGNAQVSVDLTAQTAVAAPTAPTVAETTAGDPAGPTDEVNTITFGALLEGQTVNVEGVSLTASADMTDAEVAAHFAGEDFTGTGWQVTSSNGADVVYTSTTAATDVTNISVSVEGGSIGETAPEAQGVLDARDALEAAEQALEDLNEAVAEWEAAVSLDAEVTDLEDAITSAREAIEDPEDEGGLGITLLEGNENFTAEDDVYLFEEGTNQQLSGFGANGEDKIYFGEGYSLTQIPDGDEIGDNVGDASAQEILWQQDGNNLVLFVEEETFAGNSSAGAAADITTITLTGVSAEDVNFEGGFLSAGEVA